MPPVRCHVVPPSIDTSTPATLPPPASTEVPVIVTSLPVKIIPFDGYVITVVGA